MQANFQYLASAKIVLPLIFASEHNNYLEKKTFSSSITKLSPSYLSIRGKNGQFIKLMEKMENK
ncbi:hypothetical protein CMO83_01790 [Candidatus Woesearchaeota archaeon]|nr:hypothetical protein [Candidatus Woesearchaeota archaeon]